MAKQMVEVVEGRGWSGGSMGGRQHGDEPFEYDVKEDPDGLIKLGLVQPVKAVSAPKKD